MNDGGGCASSVFWLYEGETLCPTKHCKPLLRSKPPAMRSAASYCAGTGRTSPGSTAWEPCWITSVPASRRAPNIMTVCPIWRAETVGSSWIPPCVCGCCWTLKRMLSARWICWAIRSTLLLPAGPATRCALPAMKRPMPPTARRLRRRRSSSTRPWKHWKRAMQARPCAPVSWASITGWLRII